MFSVKLILIWAHKSTWVLLLLIPLTDFLLNLTLRESISFWLRLWMLVATTTLKNILLQSSCHSRSHPSIQTRPYIDFNLGTSITVLSSSLIDNSLSNFVYHYWSLSVIYILYLFISGYYYEFINTPDSFAISIGGERVTWGV